MGRCYLGKRKCVGNSIFMFISIKGQRCIILFSRATSFLFRLFWFWASALTQVEVVVRRGRLQKKLSRISDSAARPSKHLHLLIFLYVDLNHRLYTTIPVFSRVEYWKNNQDIICYLKCKIDLKTPTLLFNFSLNLQTPLCSYYHWVSCLFTP